MKKYIKPKMRMINAEMEHQLLAASSEQNNFSIGSTNASPTGLGISFHTPTAGDP